MTYKICTDERPQFGPTVMPLLFRVIVQMLSRGYVQVQLVGSLLMCRARDVFFIALREPGSKP